MDGETDLNQLLKTLQPELNSGEYVFCTGYERTAIQMDEIVLFFREKEGNTFVLERKIADRLKLEYAFVASWITLTVHSSLQAVGLTAAFSSALSAEGISCNVVAAFYHDHIFVDINDTQRAMAILKALSA